MKALYGEFNENGYQIYCIEETTRDPVHLAGNCRYDSGQWLPPGSEGTLDIGTIEEFCDNVGKELAKSAGVEWIGCCRIENFDSLI